MRRPALQRGRLFSRIRMHVIDAGDARLGPADMVEHRLHDVRLNPDPGHAGGAGAPEIM